MNKDEVLKSVKSEAEKEKVMIDKEEFIKELIKLKFARFDENNNFITNEKRREACEVLGVPKELFNLGDSRPQRWSGDEMASKLEQLIIGEGYVTDERKVSTAITVEMRSLNSEDKEMIDEVVDDLLMGENKKEMSAATAGAKAARITVSFGVLTINGRSTGNSFEDRIEFFKKKPTALIEILLNEYQEFNLDVTNLLMEGDVEKK